MHVVLLLCQKFDWKIINYLVICKRSISASNFDAKRCVFASIELRRYKTSTTRIFSFLRYRRFSLVFQSRDQKRNEGLFWPIIWQQRKFSLNLAALLCFALLCFAWLGLALLCLGSENSVFISISSASASAAAQLQTNIWLRRLPMYLR